MQKSNPGMVAQIIKNSRLARGLTQKELAEQTNISVRSIQRIESAALLPRSYTLKTIAAVLDIPFSDLMEGKEAVESGINPNVMVNKNPRKIILSVFIPVILLLSGMAYISQSVSFPETSFEAFVFWTALCLAIGTLLYIIWQPHKSNT